MKNDEQTIISFESQQLKKVEEKIPTVSIISGNGQGKIFSLQSRNTFGRDVSADIVITDKLVSRIHLTISCEEGYFIAEDNGSTNGTYIENFRDESLQKASSPTKILPGTIIRIGSTKLTFSYKSQSDIDKESELFKSALTDSLTSIPNRTWFAKRANEELEFMRKSKLPISLAMIDIDFFKKVNDTYGHQAGDYILKTFAEILSAEKRPRDILGRYGGEEFILLLLNATNKDATKVCERIRKKIETSVFTFNKQTIIITISIGLSSNTILNSYTLEEMIKIADKYLYAAKKSGRNQVVRK